MPVWRAKRSCFKHKNSMRPGYKMANPARIFCDTLTAIHSLRIPKLKCRT